MKLNRIISALAASALALFAASCVQEEITVTPQISTDKATYEVGPEGGEIVISLLATEDWAATVDPSTSLDEVEGITVTPDHGLASDKPVEVTVNVPAWDGFNRAALISFIGGRLSGAATVKQEGAQGERVLRITCKEFNEAAVDASIFYELCGTVTSITDEYYNDFYINDGTVDDPGVYVYGLYESKGAARINYYMQQMDIREGDLLTIRTYRGEYNGTIEAIQAYYISHEKSQNPSIKLDKEAYEASAAGEVFTLNVASNKVTWTLSSDVDWIHFDPATGDASAEVAVTVDAGEGGTGVITLSADGLDPVTCTVTRADLAVITIAEFLALPDNADKAYQISGIASQVTYEGNPGLYGNFYLTDATGTVYIYGFLPEKGGATKQSVLEAKGIKDGDFVTVAAPKGSYKDSPQAVNAWYLSHIQHKTVAEFLAAADKDNPYVLIGNVANVKNTSYGNFDIVDETGSVYVYGLYDDYTKPSAERVKMFEAVGLKEGDLVYLYGPYTQYNGVDEVNGSSYIMHERNDVILPAEVYINEICTDSKEIELYNAGDTDVDIAGYAFVRNAAVSDYNPDKDKWVIPAGMGNIPAKGYAVYTAKQSDAANGPLFGLSGSKGFILELQNAEGMQVDIVVNRPVETEEAIVVIGDGESYGRKADGGDKWVIFSEPSIGANNETGTVKPSAVADMTLAEINALATGDGAAFEATVEDVVVSYVNGNNAFIEDATAGTQIYLSGHGLTAGKKIDGVISGTIKLYQNYGEMTALDYSGATLTDATFTPMVVTVEELLNNYSFYINRLVKLQGVSIKDGIAKDDRNGVVAQNGSEINLYASINGVTIETGAEGELLCIPTLYKDNKQVGVYEDSFFSAVPTSTLAELNALATADGVAFEAKVKDVMVSYVNGNNAFIEDATAGTQIYLSGHGLSADKKIDGIISGTIKLYQNYAEITALDYSKATVSDATFTPSVIKIGDLIANYASNVNRLVKIEGITVEDGIASGDRNGVIAQGEDKINLYASINGVTIETGKTGDLLCIPTLYKDNKQVGVYEESFFTEGAAPVTAKVFINEISTGDKKIEIYNPGTEAVDIAGYVFTKDSKDKWTVPAGMGNIAAGGFVVYTAKQSDEANGPTFGISGTKGFDLALAASDGTAIDHIDNLSSITTIEDSETFGRKTDGADEWVLFSAGTIGASNAGGTVKGDDVVPSAISNCGELSAAILSGMTTFSCNFTEYAELTLMGSDKKSIFVQDATGAVLVYSADLYSALQAADASAGAGIKGELSGTATIYSGLPEITALDVSKASIGWSGNWPCKNLTLAELTGANFEKYLNMKVKIEDVEVLDAFSGSDKNGKIGQNGTELNVYVKNAGISDVATVGQKGNICGYVCVYNGTKQLCLWEDGKWVATYTPDPDIPDDTTTGEYGIDLAYTGGANFYDDGVATINGVADCKVLKIGSSKNPGDFTVTVPAGTKKVSFYAVAWNGQTTAVEFYLGGSKVAEQPISANDGASGNSPYTLTVSASDKYTLEQEFSADTEIKVTASKRVLFFGLKAEKAAQ